MTLARVKTWIAGEVLTASDLNTEFDHCDNNLAVSSELAASSGSALIGFLQAGTGAVARTVQSKERDILSVVDFGASPSASAAVNTTAFNLAIAAAFASGYKSVFVPDGTYSVSNISLLHGVRLWGNSKNTCTLSSTDTVNSVIILTSYTEVAGIGFLYPNQVTNAAPTIYPPTITTASGANYVSLNCLFVQGAYDFISLGNSSYGCGPLFINDIEGFPLHYGIVLDNCIDVPHISNVHFNPNIYGSYGSTLLAWVYQNGQALRLLRVDGPQINNFFAFGYLYGLYTSTGNPSGSCNMGQFTNCFFDVCKQPLNLVAFQYGMFFSNCVFTTGGSSYNGVTGGINAIGTNNATVTGVASFVNCSFRTYYTNIIAITTYCEFTDCQFDDYNSVAGANRAIELNFDSIDVKVIGCYFDTRSRANTQGVIAPSASVSLTLSSNTFANFTGASVVNINGTLYASGNVLGGAAYTWNGVVCQDISGVLCTYQIPTVFTVTAAFSVGLRFGNYTPAVGSPKAWICTVAGTPGTWVSEGNL